MRDKYERKIAAVNINKGAWIMPGVIITPGVKIGEMAVVATGAVVNKEVEARTLVAGVPGKKIKKLE